MPLLFESRRMCTMPKRIDEQLKARAVRLVSEHRGEYPTVTAACAAVARQLGVGKESVRRWVVQAEVDDGQRQGVSSAETVQVKDLKAKVRRLEEDNAILKAATVFFAGELDPRNR
jgi:transposase